MAQSDVLHKSGRKRAMPSEKRDDCLFMVSVALPVSE
jgi:hypothetical protein